MSEPTRGQVEGALRALYDGAFFYKSDNAMEIVAEAARAYLASLDVGAMHCLPQDPHPVEDRGCPTLDASAPSPQLSDARADAGSPKDGTREPPHWKHKKRGTEYVELGRGELQSATSVIEGDVLVAYRSTHDGKVWVRAQSEFDDGRFEQLSAPPVPQEGVSKEMDQPALVDAAWDRHDFAVDEGGSAKAGMLAALAPLLEDNARLKDHLKFARQTANNTFENMKTAVERADAAEAKFKNEEREHGKTVTELKAHAEAAGRDGGIIAVANARIKELEAKLVRADATVVLETGVGIDTHDTLVRLGKDTMRKLIAAEARINALEGALQAIAESPHSPVRIVQMARRALAAAEKGR